MRLTTAYLLKDKLRALYRCGGKDYAPMRKWPAPVWRRLKRISTS